MNLSTAQQMMIADWFYRSQLVPHREEMGWVQLNSLI